MFKQKSFNFPSKSKKKDMFFFHRILSNKYAKIPFSFLFPQYELLIYKIFFYNWFFRLHHHQFLWTDDLDPEFKRITVYIKKFLKFLQVFFQFFWRVDWKNYLKNFPQLFLFLCIVVLHYLLNIFLIQSRNFFLPLLLRGHLKFNAKVYRPIHFFLFTYQSNILWNISSYKFLQALESFQCCFVVISANIMFMNISVI